MLKDECLGRRQLEVNEEVVAQEYLQIEQILQHLGFVITPGQDGNGFEYHERTVTRDRASLEAIRQRLKSMQPEHTTQQDRARAILAALALPKTCSGESARMLDLGLAAVRTRAELQEILDQ